jgi:hypothetical protein
MKKFALFAMLLCAGFLTLGCAEKKDTPKTEGAPAAEKTEGGEKAPAEQPK